MAVVILAATGARIKRSCSPRVFCRGDAVAIVSYDEKPGIQAIATTAPDLPPEPGKHAAFARDHEYKRHGTVSLLAGMRPPYRPGSRSRQGSPVAAADSSNFSGLSTPAIRPIRSIELILDNHSAHISKETQAWLANQPAGRFEFTFAPKHGSWLSLVEGCFSKLARSLKLRHSRVSQTETAVSSGPIPISCAAIAAERGRDPVAHRLGQYRHRPLPPRPAFETAAATELEHRLEH